MSANTDVENFGQELSDDALVEMVQSKSDESSVLDALKELSRRKSPRRFEMIQLVLDDPGQSVRARKIATSQLRRERLPESQALLMQRPDTKEPSLFPRVVQSLATIGEQRELTLLEQIEAPADPAARRQLEFAKSLLSYRLHLDRNLFAVPPDTALVAVTGAISFEVTTGEASVVREAIRDVEASLPALPLSQEGAASLTCRSVALLLVFTEEFQRPGALDAIRDRSAVPLVVLKKGLSLGNYFLEQYMFTQPIGAGDQVALLGARPSGELTYAGKIQISSAGFTFTLNSVDTRYAPAIDLEGRYKSSQRQFDFEKALSSTTVAARQSRAQTPSKASPRF